MPDKVREKVEKEIDRLEKMPATSAEGGVIRNYIDWLLGLPWSKHTEDDLDLIRQRKFLNEDHFGLEKPKERVLEYLAVQKLVKKLKGPILCLVVLQAWVKLPLLVRLPDPWEESLFVFRLAG